MIKPNLPLKKELLRALLRLSGGITEWELALRLRIDQPKAWKLQHEQLTEFSVERLMYFTTLLGHDVVIRITPVPLHTTHGVPYQGTMGVADDGDPLRIRLLRLIRRNVTHDSWVRRHEPRGRNFMADSKQKHTRGVPWADHTEPSSAGAANPADRSARIDPEELEGEVSPGSLASSTPASPGEATDDRPTDSHPKPDTGKRLLRYEHLSEDHRVD